MSQITHHVWPANCPKELGIQSQLIGFEDALSPMSRALVLALMVQQQVSSAALASLVLVDDALAFNAA
jgi:hypothetical protein